MNFFKLEDGMILRILPFNINSFYNYNTQYYLSKINKMFIDDKLMKHISFNTIMENRQIINRIRRYYSFVEYGKELGIIYYSGKVKDIIDESINKKCINYFLYVNKKIKMGFPDYSDSFVEYHEKPFRYDYESFFHSVEYNDLIDQYNNYLINKKSNNTIIKHLIEENILDKNYIGKMRLNKIKKINKIKNNYNIECQ